MPVIAKLRDAVRDIATQVLPASTRDWLRAQQRRLGLNAVPVGSVNFGSLDRLSPISPIFGKDRDLLTIERYHIEQFLGQHALDVEGRTLEMGDPTYTIKFGGDRVTQPDVLNYVEGNPQATIVADLTNAPHIPDNSFDCIIITQTLQMIFEIEAAIATLHRILKPGGVVLATSHGMSRVARREGVDDWGEYWHFTSQSKRKMFGDVFGRENLTVQTYGNVLSCVANLHGLAARELTPEQIDYNDPNFELLVCARAVKR
ncbi:MAG: methyltransferase domain-containing protein [Sphingobium sp.]